MENEFPFSERFNDIELKLNRISEKVSIIAAYIKDSKKPFMDLNEATQYLNVKKGTIYAWTCKNEIPYYKVGRKLYFDVDEINEWVLNKDKKYRSNAEIESEAITRVMFDKLDGKNRF